MTGPILIVSGMHRSGTSLVTSTLQAAGLDVGGQLMPAAAGNNSRGFFENLDFVDLHKRILDFHGISLFGWTLQRHIDVPEELRLQAERTVVKNQRPHPWGWKDPRTVLFLDLWSELLPQAKFLFVHRAPWEVIDSLFRRGDEAFQKDPVLALRIWEHYNRLALEFFRRHPDRCLFVEVDTVTADSSALIALLCERFRISLTPPGQSLFDSSLLRTEATTSHRARLIQMFFPEAYQLWRELRSVSALGLTDQEPADDEAARRSQQLTDDTLKDWMETKKAQRELADMEASVFELRSNLYHANQRIQYLEKSRIWKLRNRLDSVRKLLSFSPGP